MFKTIISRRLLAGLLFFNSTVGLLSLLHILDTLWTKDSITTNLAEFIFKLDFPHIFRDHFHATNDLAVYIFIFFLLVNILLVCTTVFISQNCLFLITPKNLDERGTNIRNKVVQTAFPVVIVVALVWLLAKFYTELTLFERWSADSQSGYFWTTFSTYLILIPIVITPFCVALWMDTEKTFINPYSNKSSMRNSSIKILGVCLIIVGLFGGMIYRQLAQDEVFYLDFNKKNIEVSGNAHHNIIIDPTLENGTVFSGSKRANIWNLSATGTKAQEELLDFLYNPSKQFDSMSYQTNMSDDAGLLYINSVNRLPLTDALFGVPEVTIRVRSLDSLKVTGAKSIDVKTVDGMCVDQKKFTLTVNDSSADIASLSPLCFIKK